jgi:hypothetical protein
MNLNPSPASNTSEYDATLHHGCFSKNTRIDTFIIIFRVLAGNEAENHYSKTLTICNIFEPKHVPVLQYRRIDGLGQENRMSGHKCGKPFYILPFTFYLLLTFAQFCFYACYTSRK